MDKKKRLRYYTADEIRDMKFSRVKAMPDIWGKMLGNVSETAWVLVKADPKEGKSYLVTQMVNDLSAVLGRTCYCSCEEGISASVQERLTTLNITGGNIVFVPEVGSEELLRIFKNRHNKIIVIDSPKHLKMTIDEAQELFTKFHKKKFCILVNHNHAAIEWDHLVDVVIKVKDGIAHCRGRFGANGKVPTPWMSKSKNSTPSLFENGKD